jgi:hypothetical protein
VTLALGKNPREVALVDEAAELGDISQLPAGLLQKFLGALDALFGQPSVRRQSGRLLKRTDKVAGRQSALFRNVGDRRIACQIDGDEVASAPQLPGREAAAVVISLR